MGLCIPPSMRYVHMKLHLPAWGCSSRCQGTHYPILNPQRPRNFQNVQKGNSDRVERRRERQGEIDFSFLPDADASFPSRHHIVNPHIFRQSNNAAFACLLRPHGHRPVHVRGSAGAPSERGSAFSPSGAVALKQATVAEVKRRWQGVRVARPKRSAT